MATQIVVRTDQSGANNPVNSSQSRTFNFQLFTGYDLWAASFEMKRGSGSTDGVTATVYRGFNGSGEVIIQVQKLAAEFAQAFEAEIYDFSSVGTLGIGQYSLILTSASPSGGSTDYFIKDGNSRITDIDGTTVIATFDSNGDQIDGNNELMDGGVVVGNVAADEQWFIPGTGGVVLNGNYENAFSDTATGGGTLGGEADVFGTEFFPEGGVVVEGSSEIFTSFSNQGTGGIVLSGFSSNDYNEQSNGGALLGGSAIVSGITIYNEVGSGGIQANSSGNQSNVFQNQTSGGIVVGGSANLPAEIIISKVEVLLGGKALVQYIPRPSLVSQKRTVVLEVDLTPKSTELFGPISNQREVAVYNVRTSPQEVALRDQSQNHRSMWIPGLSSIHGRNLKHGERVVVQGSQAKYALDMFTTVNGPPVSGMELLILIDDKTKIERGFYPPVFHEDNP